MSVCLPSAPIWIIPLIGTRFITYPDLFPFIVIYYSGSCLIGTPRESALCPEYPKLFLLLFMNFYKKCVPIKRISPLAVSWLSCFHWIISVSIGYRKSFSGINSLKIRSTTNVPIRSFSNEYLSEFWFNSGVHFSLFLEVSDPFEEVIKFLVKLTIWANLSL